MKIRVGDGGFDAPGFVVGRVGTLALVVGFLTGVEVLGEAGVEMGGVGDVLEDVDVVEGC